MKINKSLNKFKLIKSKSGMAILDFLFVAIGAILFIAIFIEIGYALKSEAIVMGVTKKAIRYVEINGQLDATYANKIVDVLRSYNIETDISKVQLYSNSQGNVAIPMSGTDRLPFRDNVKIVIRGTHKMLDFKFGGASGSGINLPLAFGSNGNVEYFTY